ncbi:MAG: YbeF family protein [Clostridium sp.]
MFNSYCNAQMGMGMFIYPLAVFFISIVMQLIFRKMLVILIVNIVFWLIVAFTMFDSNFIIWCFIYTFIAFFGTLIGDLIIISKNEFINKRKSL